MDSAAPELSLERTRGTGVGPIRAEELESYSLTARRTVQGLHLALASPWNQREAVKLVLRREFPRLAGFLLFKGREVPQDARLLDAVQQCPAGGLVIIHGTHSVPVLHLQKPMRLEGAGSRSHKVLLRTRLEVKPVLKAKTVQGPPVLSRGVTARFQDVNDTALEEKPPKITVQLHQIHFTQPAVELHDGPRGKSSAPGFIANSGIRQGYADNIRDPDDVDKALPDPLKSLLCVGARARVQATQCLFEETPDSSWGCGIFVKEAGCLEAVESVVKNAAEYGLVTWGSAKMAQCRILGSKVGARLLEAQGAQLLLKGCILQDNREIGVYLPPVWCFDQVLSSTNGNRDDESTWPFRCILKGSSVTRSWYPVAQKSQSDTCWERYPWVEPPEDFVGLRMDATSQLQALTEADYDRQQDVEEDRPPSRCPSSLWSADRYAGCDDDWDWTHGGGRAPEPPVPK
mmetsp:Transcript_48764/g.139479  ORF Transcript_48764/g.139479 Transcript_48764/m.139479 type:complete len:459 (-) Transcript_48764:168-1544(-)|eukprot:CAMPEP_0168387012 /NCGR_PEP_ID=MMETSP0228-20121227/15725_1 /TAXON_ID=133427 /ORGANISM="Protoceratium reticulatum, Strain CCCM 535 (=CCMP 1889)" /LENGTH=458 /DNA_ID=CAMNT_0008400233 /DNA_START=41 /DNA_END=1417 /DNA_ORIENTATION=-